MDIILNITHMLACLIGGVILFFLALGMVMVVITAIECGIKSTINKAKNHAIDKATKIFMDATKETLEKVEEALDKAIDEKVNEAIQRKLKLNPNF